jgi:hypothetical protein
VIAKTDHPSRTSAPAELELGRPARHEDAARAAREAEEHATRFLGFGSFSRFG